MVINAANLLGLQTSYEALYMRGLRSYTPFWGKLAAHSTKKVKELVLTWLGSLPTMQPFNGELKVDDLIASNWRIRTEKFAAAVSVPAEDIELDTYGLFDDQFAGMGERANMHPDRLLTNLLTGGFSTKDYTGKNFFDADKKHIKGRDAVFTNKSTKKLTQASFEEGLANLNMITDDRGEPFAPNGQVILVTGGLLDAKARSILKATTVEQGGTNISMGMAEHLKVEQLGTSTAWFLFKIGGVFRPFIFHEEKKTAFSAMIDPNSPAMFNFEKAIYKAHGRYTMAYGLPQLAWGSTGVDD